jgi:hypothetical protein
MHDGQFMYVVDWQLNEASKECSRSPQCTLLTQSSRKTSIRTKLPPAPRIPHSDIDDDDNRSVNKATADPRIFVGPFDGNYKYLINPPNNDGNDDDDDDDHDGRFHSRAQDSTEALMWREDKTPDPNLAMLGQPFIPLLPLTDTEKSQIGALKAKGANKKTRQKSFLSNQANNILAASTIRCMKRKDPASITKLYL